MGGENSATTRRRLAGKICGVCKTILDEPPPSYRPSTTTGERYCDRCGPRYEVIMKFETLFSEWSVICEADGRIIRRLTLANADRVVEMAKQGGGLRSPADRKTLDTALLARRGMVTLRLTESQFARLKDKTHRPRKRNLLRKAGTNPYVRTLWHRPDKARNRRGIPCEEDVQRACQ
jgi:hypothetical protein